MTDRNAVLTRFNKCPCGGHQCHRCHKDARQLKAWNIYPVDEQPEPVPEPAKKKNKKEKH